VAHAKLHPENCVLAVAAAAVAICSQVSLRNCTLAHNEVGDAGSLVAVGNSNINIRWVIW
jgi:hypothetical protein